ncbi:tRNA 2-thiouridine(34) synthase MnmA [Patescibacteria group bacterium]|nr:tRNA 2-thiouridine(34) synthase MnmA [Patescibacteria group bacterium]
MNKNKPKVLVAMSGGVDSSVAAALLLEQGYEVIGIFMKFWSESLTGSGQGIRPTQLGGRLGPLTQSILPENKCCSIKAYEDARRVADKLNIKLYTMNMKSIFKKHVVDNFLDEYSRGRTPNPCVECNKYVKFGEFLKRAKRLDCDYIATGHYVKKTRKQKNKKAKKQTKLLVTSYQLRMANDKAKDQSYFLWTLSQAQLKHCLFPIGDYTKPQVRKVAKKKKLPVFEKAESQGICFIKDKRHYDFLRRHLKLKPGPIITLDGVKEKGIKPGSVIGEHQGLPLYTIGQRREILIGGIGPFYVVKLDYQKNILYVANKFDQELLFKDQLTAKNINWISGFEPKFPLKCRARIRYLHPAVEAVLTKNITKQHKIFVKFKKSQRAITPGQSVVFYSKNEVLGGGVIE